jgi:tRNA uridine 5-carboxymethylaminomethyl modification enzyme
VKCGLVGGARRSAFEEKAASLASGRDLLQTLSVSPTVARKAGVPVNEDGKSRTAFELLSYPNIGREEVERLWPSVGTISPAVMEQLVVDAQYAVYLDRQRQDVEAVRRDESRAIPQWVDYSEIAGLSMELRQKLTQARPMTIAQAQAVDGMTPAAITLLLAVVRRGELRNAS